MSFSIYEWVIIFTNIFWTYTIYKFLEVFYGRKKTSQKVEITSYVVYYLLLTLICLFAYLPIVLMIYSFTAFMALSYNYESTLKNRMVSTLLIYLIFAGIDITVSLLSGYLSFSLFSQNTYSSIFGLIACRILSYLIVLVLNNFKNIKKGESVPNSYWFAIVLIPVSSLYINLLLFQSVGISVGQVMIGIVLIFLINFATFYLYDAVTAAASDKMQSMLILEQNKYYDRQLETIKSSLQTTGSIRHDLKNHMLSIRALIESGDTEESLNYITNIMSDIGAKGNLSATGNTVIDSVINFKLQEAEHRNIRTNLDLSIPEHLNIPSFDMTIILGNLLDNAIRAAHKIEGDSFLNIKLSYDKSRLLVRVENPYIGDICEKDGDLVTTDDDKENHGIGLRNVKKVIQKYNGTMTIDYRNGLFSISVLLYLD